MRDSFCPATMCPLTSPNGSVWTGEYNAHCEGDPCGWWDKSKQRCTGGSAAMEQVYEVTVGGRPLVLQAHSERIAKPATYDCARAKECQWQIEVGDKNLCPPRFALSKGIDPRVCLY